MKKHLLLLILCFYAFAKAYSQQHILDTIYANDQKNVALFFPEPIRQGITGSENFVFTYNREKEQRFGLLQAKPGKESNLLIINKDGAIFSYIVKYQKELSNLNIFVSNSSSLGNENPQAVITPKVTSLESTLNNKDYYYQNFCQYLLNQNQQKSEVKNRKNGVSLSIDNIVFDKEELYFVITIKNTSTLDYDVNFLNLSIVIRQKGKKKSLQKLHLESLFEYKVPNKIKEGTAATFVYVLSKFSLSNDRKAILDLNEKNGERNVELKISHRHINNPN